MWSSLDAQVPQVIVFNGIPETRCNAWGDSSYCEKLTESQKNEFRLLIVKEITPEGPKYYWETRERRELVYVPLTGGKYDNFVCDRGYVKIQRSAEIRASFPPEMIEPGAPNFHYMEHMHQNLWTITYWGSAEEFDP